MTTEVVKKIHTGNAPIISTATLADLPNV